MQVVHVQGDLLACTHAEELQGKSQTCHSFLSGEAKASVCVSLYPFTASQLLDIRLDNHIKFQCQESAACTSCRQMTEHANMLKFPHNIVFDMYPSKFTETNKVIIVMNDGQPC